MERKVIGGVEQDQVTLELKGHYSRDIKRVRIFSSKKYSYDTFESFLNSDDSKFENLILEHRKYFLNKIEDSEKEIRRLENELNNISKYIQKDIILGFDEDGLKKAKESGLNYYSEVSYSGMNNSSLDGITVFNTHDKTVKSINPKYSAIENNIINFRINIKEAKEELERVKNVNTDSKIFKEYYN